MSSLPQFIPAAYVHCICYVSYMYTSLLVSGVVRINNYLLQVFVLCRFGGFYVVMMITFLLPYLLSALTLLVG